MLEFPTWKRIWLWLITLAVVAAAVPSMVTIAGFKWPDGLPDRQIALGLDLAGGSHLLLEASPDQVGRQRLETMEEDVRRTLRLATPRIAIGDLSTANGRLSFLLADPSQLDAAREEVLPLLNGSGTTREWNLEVVDGSRIVLTPTQAGLKAAVSKAMDSATDVIRKRIDALGTREPTIIREGDNRIVVQVPGLGDPEKLKSLVGKTAKLEFKLVDGSALPENIAKGIAPPGSEIVPYAPGTPGQGTSIAVKRLGGIRGDSLTNAKAGRDARTNENNVDISFDQQGGAKFAALTSQNVGKPFAIILDGKVLSAPNINEPILGGRASIAGSFTPDSANELAIALNSGALPVDLTVVDERTVGPELGADSIHKGLLAMGVGTGLIVLLIAFSYGRFGIYANLAVIINVLMILGVMAMFGTTLTLPGIAGFVLTIGTAVDANVLINERIGEERRRGRKVFQAVDLGYQEASRTIFDANITHVIAATLMFLFGTGPIKGFAVVLMIGIATSVFTAVTLTRMWVAGWLRRARPSDINI
ncbi:MAG: protein translocase subunit SecD [Candidatus Andeanibacterium colombiense]|uniref:Protein translocase subunit SecD n=1 Tax=Candidatus Andeanibacterium colombiense TaxID=3121345 RepID=A0AAJ5X8V5_9SPHN|nr:MAG: protein translocase subunit SecD [Sphingomonadaceae bacterium]